MYGICQETIIIDAFVAGYWIIGFRDLKQKTHALLRNFPVLANLRFIFEMVRPEIRQYIVESDEDGKPYDRHHRSMVYQRSKNVADTIPFGTRRDVYGSGYEFAVKMIINLPGFTSSCLNIMQPNMQCHSMFPKTVSLEDSRVVIGGKDCKQPYSASLLNISGMSYGALSDNAILALSSAAKLG